MGQDAINNILQGLALGQRRRTENIQLAQNQQAQQNLKEYRDAEIQRQRDELDEHHRQFDLTSKAAIALHKVQVMKSQQDIASGIQAGQASPPGVQVGKGIDENHIGLDFGDGNEPIQVLNPSAYNKSLTAQKQAEIQPGVEAQESARRQAEIDRMNEIAATQAYQTTRDQQNQDYQKARQDETIKAENLRAGATNATHLQAARIAAGGEFDPDALANYIKQGIHGDLSAKQLQQLPVPKAVKSAITGAVSAAGGQLISDDQQQLPAQFQQAISSVKNLDDYNQILRSNPMMARIPGTDAYKQRNALSGMIDSALPNTSVLLSGVKRLSTPEMMLVQKGEKPSANFLSSDADTNEMRRNGFVQDLHNAFDAKTSNLPTAQRAILKQKSGIDQIPMLKSGQPHGSVQAPGSQPTGGGTHLFFDAQGQPIQQPGAQQ